MRFRYGLVSEVSTIEKKLQAEFRSSGYQKQYNACKAIIMPVIYEEGYLDFVRWGGRGISAVAAASGIVRHPRFRHAIRNRRCLIPANYWLLLGRPPYLIHSLKEKLITFAGVCNSYIEPGDEPRITTCFSIILAPAPQKLQSLATYAPVIIHAGDRRKWLRESSSLSQMTRLLNPMGEIDGFPVSEAINNPSENTRQSINPIGYTLDQQLTLLRRRHTEEIRTDRKRYKEMLGKAKEREQEEKRHRLNKH